MKRRWGIAFACLLALTFTVFVGCSDDDNPPVTGTLSGQVVLYGEWPDSGDVQLSIFNNWSTNPCSWCGVAPGTGPAYFTDPFVDPNPNNGAGPDTISFSISGITLGQYAAVAVGWRAPNSGSINCTEPVIGLYGARWGTNDSIPEAVTFTEGQPNISVTVDGEFDMLPIPGCFEGTISGSARIEGDWPQGGLLVMLTAFPVTAWMPVQGIPTGYHFMPTLADTNFMFTVPYGSYYLSIWTLAQPPAPIWWYGSYGLDTQVRPGNPSGNDARPDAVTISAADTSADGINIEGFTPAPHWLSGEITFNGTRPAEGLLVMITTEPVSPEQFPSQQPFGYFFMTDEADSLYAVSGMPDGTYYVSLWNTLQGQESICYGAYGYTAGSDPDPDPLTVNSTTWGFSNVDIVAP